MKITQKKQKKREYIIEMTGKEFDMFTDNLEKIEQQILIRALKRTFAEALRGMKNIKIKRKELKELKKFGLKIKNKKL